MKNYTLYKETFDGEPADYWICFEGKQWCRFRSHTEDRERDYQRFKGDFLDAECPEFQFNSWIKMGGPPMDVWVSPGGGVHSTQIKMDPIAGFEFGVVTGRNLDESLKNDLGIVITE